MDFSVVRASRDLEEEGVCVEFGGRKATMVSEKVLKSLLPKGWCIDSCVVFENFVHKSINEVDVR